MRPTRRNRGAPCAPDRWTAPAALLALPLLLFAVGAAAPVEDFDAPVPEWCDGPVRYVLPQEDKVAYRKLLTTEDRARFIRRFWAARDPDRTTPENEYRALFLHRLDEAQRQFTSESTKPGWKTDRGKIWILIGPPDESEEQATRSRGDLAIRPDVINWIYRNPTPGAGGTVNVQVRFLLDTSGEYRLSTGARLFSNDLAMSQAFALQAMQLKAIPGAGPTVSGEVAEAPAVPPGFRTHVDVFASAKDRVLVILTLFVPDAFFHADDGGAPPRLEVTARLASDTPGGPTYELTGPASLRTAAGPLGRGADGAHIYQGGLAVRPGDYKVRYALVGPGAETLRAFDDTLAAPMPPAGRLTVGPISFARRLERLAEAAASEYVPPFVLGGMRVVPRSDALFSPDEELAFYYQVSGAMNDPIGGVPDLEVEYVVLLETQGAAGVTTQPLGHPIHLTREPSLIQAFSLPLAGWASGRYRLQVHVTDNLNGNVAASEIAFQVR
jgi:GWxTD domain-containing protein